MVPGLFIGGQNSALVISKLHENKIKRVLKVNGVESSIRFSTFGIELKVMDIDDMPDFNIRPYFEEAHEFIHAGLSCDEGVLVVCTAGISRSAAIVISYLIRHNNMTFDEAFKTTKTARVYIQPNPGFERTLKLYAAKLRCELCNLQPKTPWFE